MTHQVARPMRSISSHFFMWLLHVYKTCNNVIRYYFEETPTGLVHMKQQELMERIRRLFMDVHGSA